MGGDEMERNEFSFRLLKAEKAELYLKWSLERKREAYRISCKFHCYSELL